jgi:hypothetical protein
VTTIARSVVMSLAVALSITSANAQTDDRPLRAAYCIGVFEEQIAANKAQPPTFSFCEQWQSKGFASQGACNAQGQRIGITGLQSQLELYKQYLSIHLRTMSPYAKAQVAIRQKQGGLDTRAMRGRELTEQEKECLRACKGKEVSSCVAGCYDREHPTDASVVRCGGDALPF